jgi:hypothetical protein
MAKVLRFQKDDAAERQQKIDELFAQADQFLQQYPLRYAQAQNRYLIPCHGRWEMVTPESMPHRFSEFTDAAFRTAVSVRMEEKGWKYTTVTYSFQHSVAQHGHRHQVALGQIAEQGEVARPIAEVAQAQILEHCLDDRG